MKKEKNNNKRKYKRRIKVEPGYISLREASEICPYSQEYLSLLARKGRLRCKKFGRTWYTTIESLQEYIKSQGIPVIIPKFFYAPLYKGKITKPVFATFGPTFEEPETKKPEGFELEEPEVKEVKKEAEKEKTFPLPEIFQKEFKKVSLSNLAKFVAPIIAAGIIFLGWESGAFLLFKDYGKWVSTTTKEFVLKGFRNFKRYFVEVSVKEKEVIRVSPEEIFLFERDFSDLEEDIVSDVRESFGEFRKEYGLIKPGEKEEEQGMVIVPKDLKEKEKIKKELEMAFADKVEVIPDETGKAGIIKPVFAAPSPTSQEYFFMMVPVKEE